MDRHLTCVRTSNQMLHQMITCRFAHFSLAVFRYAYLNREGPQSRAGMQAQGLGRVIGHEPASGWNTECGSYDKGWSRLGAERIKRPADVTPCEDDCGAATLMSLPGCLSRPTMDLLRTCVSTRTYLTQVGTAIQYRSESTLPAAAFETACCSPVLREQSEIGD